MPLLSFFPSPPWLPRHVFIAFLIIRTVVAIQMVYNTSIPATLTDACSKALLTNVDCRPTVKNFRSGFFYTPETLSKACTDNCKTSLDKYWDAVKKGCGNETMPGSYDRETSPLVVPGTYKVLYESICLKDGDRYCNNIAATAAAIADPGVSRFNYLDGVPEDAEPPEDCDMCFVKSLKLQAGSPYFDGPMLASMSAYESKTSSCGVTGQPMSKTTLGYFTEKPKVTSTPCSGKNYTIKPEDDCHSISRDQGIGTAWLLSDNNLASYCADFPESGNLCLVNTCDVYSVKTNDTCNSIARSAGITVPQLKTWNPIINAGCYNMPRLNGAELCISAPGTKFEPPETSDLAPVTPTTAAPIPSDVAENSNEHCGRWYSVKKGDYCNLLVMKFGISVEDFIFLNPDINKNCTNLYAEASYCVQAIGDIETYSGRPGYIATTDGPTAIETPFRDRPNATATPWERLYTDLPLAKGTRDDCVHYFHGDDYQFNVNGTGWNSNCEIVVEIYDVDVESFESWNAGLNVSSPDCSFQKGVRYCGSWYAEKPENQEVPSTTNGPTTTTTDSGPTSTKSPTETSTPTESSTKDPPPSTTTDSPKAPGPTHSGQPAKCNKWHVVEDGDTCDTVAKKADITREQFLKWNPAVSKNCKENFWLESAYCVGVSKK